MQVQLKELKKSIAQREDRERLEEMLWQTLTAFQGQPFYTVKNLEFVYEIRGNEMFVTRKDKSITRASVSLAFWRAWRFRSLREGWKGEEVELLWGELFVSIFLSLGIMEK